MIANGKDASVNARRIVRQRQWVWSKGFLDLNANELSRSPCSEWLTPLMYRAGHLGSRPEMPEARWGAVSGTANGSGAR